MPFLLVESLLISRHLLDCIGYLLSNYRLAMHYVFKKILEGAAVTCSEILCLHLRANHDNLRICMTSVF
jgi:hypothetical protein